MKELVQRGIERIFTDCYATAKTIEKKFDTVHELELQKNPNWSIAATRQVLITNYWYAELKSFLLLLILFITCTTILTGQVNAYKLTSDALMLAILFFTFHFFLFRPKYYSEYLPVLENKTARFQHEQQHALITQLKKQLAEQQEKAALRYEQLREEEQQKRELQEANILKSAYSGVKFTSVPLQTLPLIPPQSLPPFRCKLYHLFRSKVYQQFRCKLYHRKHFYNKVR